MNQDEQNKKNLEMYFLESSVWHKTQLKSPKVAITNTIRSYSMLSPLVSIALASIYPHSLRQLTSAWLDPFQQSNLPTINSQP
jgi:hypothetical protein